MRFLFVVLFLFHAPLRAIAETDLPEPLTLPFALSLASEAKHPELQLIDAQRAAADARRLSAQSSYGTVAEMELRARWIDPSALALEQSRDDHRVLLRLQKKLYDFGRSQQQIEAEDTEVDALKINRQAEIESRKIAIARRYFDVLLSDLRFSWQDEAMATAYVSYDRIRDQHELGQVSDVDLLRAEADYQKIRIDRYSSEIQQRQSRALLAQSLNRPQQLSSKLEFPKLSVARLKLPDYEVLQEKVLTGNPQILFARQKLEAALQRLQAAKIAQRPELSAEVDFAKYSRNTAGNNDWRAGLYLTMPLFENPQLKAEISRKRADWLTQKAELENTQLQVRQQLLDLWQGIGLLKVNYEQLMAEQEARELVLDKSRALYEMEVKTDLGNAMVDISEMQFKQAQLEFELAISWMNLQWILGEKVNVE